MKTPQERLDHCDHEIAQAIEESRKSHTQAEHVGILLWEWIGRRSGIVFSLNSPGQRAAA